VEHALDPAHQPIHDVGVGNAADRDVSAERSQLVAVEAVGDVQDPYVLAAAQEPANQVASGEARAARNENSHAGVVEAKEVTGMKQRAYRGAVAGANHYPRDGIASALGGPRRGTGATPFVVHTAN
jgi:hypothetical protein